MDKNNGFSEDLFVNGSVGGVPEWKSGHNKIFNG